MKKGNQRQEVLFLGLAVAVLVVVVVLMVARSAPKPAAKPKPPEPVQAAAPEKPRRQARAEQPAQAQKPVAAALPSPNRDPFISNVTPAAARAAVPSRAASQPQSGGSQPGGKPETALKLVGVMQSQGTPMAIIYDGDDTYYAKPGTRVGDYVLTRISGNRAVLTRGAEQITLEFVRERKSRGRGSVARGTGWQRTRTSR